jgi:hypothetical protein
MGRVIDRSISWGEEEGYETLMYIDGQDRSGAYSRGKRNREITPSTTRLRVTITAVIGFLMAYSEIII